jgi:hypothetical protein
VSLEQGVAVVSEFMRNWLCVYSLADGSLVSRIGSEGREKGQFRFGNGDLCVSPDGESVLVADLINNRVQQIRIADGSWVRFIGEGVLQMPHYLDCNTEVVVVSELGEEDYGGRISVFSWVGGGLRAQFGTWGSGPGQLGRAGAVKLLANGRELVVIDKGNHRLCVFTVGGEFVSAIGSEEDGLHSPKRVLEYVSDGGGFIVSSWEARRDVVKFNRAGAKVGESAGSGTSVKLRDGGVAIKVGNDRVLKVFNCRDLRREWVTACATLAVREMGSKPPKRVKVVDA